MSTPPFVAFVFFALLSTNKKLKSRWCGELQIFILTFSLTLSLCCLVCASESASVSMSVSAGSDSSIGRHRHRRGFYKVQTERALACICNHIYISYLLSRERETKTDICTVFSLFLWLIYNSGIKVGGGVSCYDNHIKIMILLPFSPSYESC